MNDVILAIRAVKTRKISEKIEPTHATIRDLIHEGCTMPEIRKAAKDGAVGFGETINSHYFF